MVSEDVDTTGIYSYEKEQIRLQRLIDECFQEDNEVDTEEIFDDDEGETDVLEHQVLDTDTEQEISDDELQGDSGSNRGVFYIGKDSITRSEKHKPRQPQNIIKVTPGETAATNNLNSPLEIWKHFFTDEVLELVVQFTNEHIFSVQANVIVSCP
ncbi:hypothetical protein FQA39_LY04964 [Lamprigera yunnana]|nr:hypothetical protein FQA39_LY04964 [Lamprigera yunnana]